MQSSAQRNLKAQTVLILGGSTGIGFATAKEAAQQGATVIIVSSNQQRLDKALEQLPSASKSYMVDLSDEQSVKKFFQTIGNIDHLVYTAGENIQQPTLATLNINEAKNFLDLRFWGALTAVKYGTPYINKNGSIVFTGGSAGTKTGKGWLMATSICRAMEGVTKTLAIELAPIRVNLVAPGLVKTNLWNSMNETDRNNLFNNTAAALPVQYIASAEDIALTFVHCMLQPYLTGQQIIVDGGYTLL